MRYDIYIYIYVIRRLRVKVDSSSLELVTCSHLHSVHFFVANIIVEGRDVFRARWGVTHRQFAVSLSVQE